MSPAEFFERGIVGSIVRYDVDYRMSVRVTFISRLCTYACGRETGTNRIIYLRLSNNMLREGDRACFNDLDLSA